MAKQIPAGLIDDGVEFFSDPSNHDVCFCLTNGRVYRVKELPDDFKAAIRKDMASHPSKAEALVALGYEHDDEQLEKYCSCCFGLFDFEPDFVAGKFIHNEYVPCDKRGICPAEGKLCNALRVGEGTFLTRREIDILVLIGACLLDKEIADQLAISEETVKIHKKHICEKSGLSNKKDLVRLAYQKNLC